MTNKGDVEEFVDHSKAEFEKYYNEFADQFMDDFKDILKDSAKEAKKRLTETMKRAGSLYLKSMTAKTADLRDDYKRSSDESFEMARLIMYGEAIVISNQTANVVLAGFKAGVKGFAGAMKASVSIAVSGAVKGLLAGVIV